MAADRPIDRSQSAAAKIKQFCPFLIKTKPNSPIGSIDRFCHQNKKKTRGNEGLSSIQAAVANRNLPNFSVPRRRTLLLLQDLPPFRWVPVSCSAWAPTLPFSCSKETKEALPTVLLWWMGRLAAAAASGSISREPARPIADPCQISGPRCVDDRAWWWLKGLLASFPSALLLCNQNQSTHSPTHPDNRTRPPPLLPQEPRGRQWAVGGRASSDSG